MKPRLRDRFFWSEERAGQYLPRCWGVIYRDPMRNGTWLAPIPFNLPLRWIRLWFMRMRYGKWDAENYHLRSQVWALHKEVEYLRRGQSTSSTSKPS